MYRQELKKHMQLLAKSRLNQYLCATFGGNIGSYQLRLVSSLRLEKPLKILYLDQKVLILIWIFVNC